MNIDVKNAFDKVTTICDSLVHKVSNAESFHKIFLEDIFNFICSISTTGELNRYDCFINTLIPIQNFVLPKHLLMKNSHPFC